MFLFCFIFYQITVNTNSYNWYKHSSKKTCRYYLLFSRKTALTTNIMLGISIILFRGNSSSELNLIFIYFWIDIFFMVWLTNKTYLAYFHLGPLPEILIIVNLQHTASRIWTCAELEFRLCWMNFCISDNHYTTLAIKSLILIQSSSHILFSLFALITKN